ncbi:MAG: F0F1 ATP synthase subunit B [Alphaproteobacteria bacterium]|nr:F0F1 ATP synthase subunit B [Alphaproteobacteria bacterium]
MLQSPDTWVAVGFVIFVAAIAKPVMRAINRALDARAARIKATLDEAAKLREDAQHLLAEYQRKSRNAMKEADDLLAAASSQAARLAEEQTAALEASLKTRERLALERIALAEAEALKEVRETAVDVALAATRKLIADNLDATRGGALIESAIAELPRRLN